MNNPFIELLNKIEYKVRHDESPPDELLVVVASQLKLLKVLYRSMLEFSMKDNMLDQSVIGYEEYSYKSTKSILDYLQFINVLNQLGRILKKYGIIIPKYNRINFFRNKVSEHWEEYTQYGITGSQYQLPGEAAIPSTNTFYKPEEREKIKSEIDKILENYGLVLDVDNPRILNIADFNVEKIYSTLEKIDCYLTTPNSDPTTKKHNKYIIPDRLVVLLFQFGFPAPIDKVTEYSSEVVSFLEMKLEAYPSKDRPLTSKGG